MTRSQESLRSLFRRAKALGVRLHRYSLDSAYNHLDPPIPPDPTAEGGHYFLLLPFTPYLTPEGGRGTPRKPPGALLPYQDRWNNTSGLRFIQLERRILGGVLDTIERDLLLHRWGVGEQESGLILSLCRGDRLARSLLDAWLLDPVSPADGLVLADRLEELEAASGGWSDWVDKDFRICLIRSAPS